MQAVTARVKRVPSITYRFFFIFCKNRRIPFSVRIFIGGLNHTPKKRSLQMKLSKKILAAFSATALLATASIFTSCTEEDDDDYGIIT